MGDKLKQKVAIVTGAGAIAEGIGNGKAAAIVFAREGARVMLVDINLEAAEDTKRLIDEEGGECFAFQTDVTKSEDCKRMVEKCIQTYGRVDILHNSVGIASMGGIYATSEEDFDKVMDINLKSMFLTCKHVLPYMENQGGGSITNISTVCSIRSFPFPTLAYGVSKAGVNALTRELASEFARKGIRVNAILPGIIRTPFVVSALMNKFNDLNKVEQIMKERDEMLPMGTQGDPWDVAYAALFLNTDEAKYITGTTLVVDGLLSSRMHLA